MHIGRAGLGLADGAREVLGSGLSSWRVRRSAVIRDTVKVVEDRGSAGGPGELDQSRAALLADAANRAGRYLQGLAHRPVAPSAEAVLALDELDFALPEAGLEPSRVLAALDEVGSAATVPSAGPRYFGFVTGGALPIAVAASWLLSAWDQNAALSVMSPAATRLDAVAIRSVCRLLGLSRRDVRGLRQRSDDGERGVPGGGTGRRADASRLGRGHGRLGRRAPDPGGGRR